MTASRKLRFLYREHLKLMSLNWAAQYNTWLLIISTWCSLFFETDENSKVGQDIMLAMMLLAVVLGSK